MSNRDHSFEKILEESPTLDELYEHVKLSTKWYEFGVLLKLDVKKLSDIEELNKNADHKALKMFELWLNTSANATRRQVLDTLRKDSIREIAVAEIYEKSLSRTQKSIKRKRSNDAISGPPTKRLSYDTSATGGKVIPLCLPNDYEWDETSNTCKKVSVKRDSLVINEEAVKILEGITNPISVVAVVGACRSGKSYLLNQLTPSKESLFILGHTMVSKTMGIWMWDTPFQHTLESGEEVTVILLDTEGVDAVKAGSRGDTQVFTLSVLLSSLLVYNSTQVPKRENLNQMTFIANLAKSFASRGSETMSSFKQIAPSFLWLLRDALLQPVNSEGSPCNFRDYLLEEVLAVPEDFPVDDIQTQASKCLLEFFVSLDAEMIPPPSLDPHVIANIEDPSYRKYINPKFIQQIEHVRRKILDVCQPKRGYTEGSLMNGIQFTEIVRMYIDALNSEDGIPKIETAWDQAMKNLYQTATSRAKEIYKKAMNGLQFPIDEKDLLIHHEEAYKESEKLFNQLTELDGDRDAYEKNLKDLTATIATYSDDSSICNGGLLYHYCEENKQESQKYCQELLGNLRIKHLNPILENLSHETSYDKIVTIIGEIKQCYFKESKGPAQEDQFKRFMENLEVEKKQFISTLNRMKSYDDQLQDLIRQKKATDKILEDKQKVIEKLQDELRARDEKIIQLMESMESMKSQKADVNRLMESIDSEKRNKAVTTKPKQENMSTSTSLNSSEDTQLNKGDVGRVKWRSDDNTIHMISPTIKNCEDVVSRLKEEQQTGGKWSIWLHTATAESALVIIVNLNECTVWRLGIWNTPLNDAGVSALSEIFITNKTLKRLFLESSPLAGVDAIKHLSNVLATNATLETLEISNVNITDEDTSHLSDMLTNNKTLKELDLTDCNITDSGIQNISEALKRNQTMTTLNISNNPSITSDSTSALFELINTTKSLTQLSINNTSLKDNDIKTICYALITNNTIKKLELSVQHLKSCEKFDFYQIIKSKLRFL